MVEIGVTNAYMYSEYPGKEIIHLHGFDYIIIETQKK